MPIRPAMRDRYPANWPELSRSVREEAGQKCERCKAPNGQTIARGAGTDAGTYMLEHGEVFDDQTGERRGTARGSEYEVKRWTRVVLTVAHVDHDPSNNARSNLRAWCQKCHLEHDRDEHTTNARETRRSRKAAGNLPGIE